MIFRRANCATNCQGMSELIMTLVHETLISLASYHSLLSYNDSYDLLYIDFQQIRNPSHSDVTTTTYLMSVLLTASIFICRRKPLIVYTDSCPILVMHAMFISLYCSSLRLLNVQVATRLVRDPSCAVSFHLSSGFSVGIANIYRQIHEL